MNSQVVLRKNMFFLEPRLLRAMIKFPFKVIAAFGLVTFYLVVGAINYFFSRNNPLFHKKAAYLTHLLAKVTLKAFDIRVKVIGTIPKNDNQGVLLVANHLSYLDVVGLAAINPAVFVTSVEVKNSFFLGDMAKVGGSLFVERRKRQQIPREIKELADVIAAGSNVCVFPEATSSDGTQVLPFKSSFFASAKEVSAPIVPVCLNYQKVNGQSMSESANFKRFRDSVFWYGDMDFLSHLLRMLSLDSMELHVNILDVIEVSSEDDRKSLAEKAYAKINECYFRQK